MRDALDDLGREASHLRRLLAATALEDRDIRAFVWRSRNIKLYGT